MLNLEVTFQRDDHQTDLFNDRTKSVLSTKKYGSPEAVGNIDFHVAIDIG